MVSFPLLMLNNGELLLKLINVILFAKIDI